MSTEWIALWLGIISGVIAIVGVIHAKKMGKVLRTTAVLCVIAVCVVILWQFLRDRSHSEADASPHLTADNKQNPTSPPPAIKSTNGSKERQYAGISPGLRTVLSDIVFYKQAKHKGFDVNLLRPPYEVQIPIRFLGKEQIEIIRKEAESEINRPTDRGYRITQVTHLRFTLSETGDRFSSVLVYLGGTQPKLDGLPGETEPLVPADSGDSAAVTLSLSEIIWTSDYSDRFAVQLLKTLHAELGVPDRGEVREREIQLVE